MVPDDSFTLGQKYPARVDMETGTFDFILDIPLCFAVYLGLNDRQRRTNDNI